MANNATTLSALPPKLALDTTDRFIIYSPIANGSFSIAASALVEPSNAVANGYTTLGGGVIMNWGSVSVSNTTPATIVFSQPFVTTPFTINITGTVANTAAQATGLTLTGATVVTGALATNSIFYYTALGI